MIPVHFPDRLFPWHFRKQTLCGKMMVSLVENFIAQIKFSFLLDLILDCSSISLSWESARIFQMVLKLTIKDKWSKSWVDEICQQF
jgi:hypothetical protein